MLSRAQIEQYHKDGYLMLEGYFPREDMARLLSIARSDQALAQNATDRFDTAGRTSRLSLRFDLLAAGGDVGLTFWVIETRCDDEVRKFAAEA